jgi:hypothetical protein
MRNIALVILLAACHRPMARSSGAPVAPPVLQPPTMSAAPAAAPVAEQGFDFKVRGDFFDGLRGDTVALDRMMKLCEDELAARPDHPEAMVWHGAGMIGRSGAAFRSGDGTAAMKLYTQGIAEMDRAVALAPSNIGVRIPRGAVLLVFAPFVPEPEKSRLIQRGVGDYEVALAAQTPRFGTLSLHAREQLLYGLTDGYASLGDTAKAQLFYRRMTTDAAGSELLTRARARATGEEVAGPTPCQQCHGR